MPSNYPAEPSWDDLGRVFKQAYNASSKEYQNHLARLSGSDGYEVAPIRGMLASSTLLGLARQAQPHSVGATALGEKLANVLPAGKPREIVSNLPLGGYSQQERNEYSAARQENPELRRYTVELGKLPALDGPGEVEAKTGNYRAKAAQVAGVAANDLVTDGLRNIWWFLNAPQAITTVAMLHGMHSAGQKFKEQTGQDKYIGKDVPLITRRAPRMAALAPAWIAMSMGIGNFGREPGYKATLPSEVDPRQTTDPVGEVLNRYFLGRTGALLGYDEFVKDRPDVSKQEYEEYKAYLFGNGMPIKATLDGIHGPEVTFMGKSIPVATGVLPAVAAVIGARRGMRVGAEKVAAAQGYERAQRSGREYELIKQDFNEQEERVKRGLNRVTKSSKKKEVTREEYESAYKAYRDQVDANESQVAKSVLVNSAGMMSGTALAGHVLESVRRAMKGTAPQEETPEEV
jgi:hypothetical protein